METVEMDRRKMSPKASGLQQQEIVKEGIRLQACLGTIGAIEYLKRHEVNGAVISRILSGGRSRKEDADAWAARVSAQCHV